MMRKHIIALSSGRGRGQHPGLLLQRFVAHAADGSDRWSTEKRDLLAAAISAAGNPELRAALQIRLRAMGHSRSRS